MDSRPEKCSEAFIQHGIYLRNWSKTTVRTYRQGVSSLHAHIGETLPTKSTAEEWVMSLRQRGLAPGGVNMYVRSVNLEFPGFSGEVVDPTCELLRIAPD
jgi:hypothetical protein